MRSTGADEETAAILHVEPGFPLLVITRVSFDANGIPREYGVWKYRSNLYYLEMSLVK
jgi:DNA-binding GntR family transcriptional regulator